jgi:hypothetical protein
MTEEVEAGERGVEVGEGVVEVSEDASTTADIEGSFLSIVAC